MSPSLHSLACRQTMSFVRSFQIILRKEKRKTYISSNCHCYFQQQPLQTSRKPPRQNVSRKKRSKIRTRRTNLFLQDSQKRCHPIRSISLLKCSTAAASHQKNQQSFFQTCRASSPTKPKSLSSRKESFPGKTNAKSPLNNLRAPQKPQSFPPQSSR